MKILNDEFCDETPQRENICDLCGKKLPYVDSPYGAIPTLELFNKFKVDLIKEFEEEKSELKNLIRTEIDQKFATKETELKS
ncbi:MAG: hypothetical protein GF311_05870, partial [Candidatus Lokiarchaeota archaeon]|nr:hypothetical protein [Candidatus Lokiarchaeota archaeon]